MFLVSVVHPCTSAGGNISSFLCAKRFLFWDVGGFHHMNCSPQVFPQNVLNQGQVCSISLTLFFFNHSFIERLVCLEYSSWTDVLIFSLIICISEFIVSVIMAHRQQNRPKSWSHHHYVSQKERSDFFNPNLMMRHFWQDTLGIFKLLITIFMCLLISSLWRIKELADNIAFVHHLEQPHCKQLLI